MGRPRLSLFFNRPLQEWLRPERRHIEDHVVEQKTFTGSTVEEATKAKERWLSAHNVAVKKEYIATLSKPAGRFTPIASGTVTDIAICIEYEEEPKHVRA
jgi:hypothetical protein